MEPIEPGRRIVVALDGPASSGKSSVGAAAARVVRYRFCDTGLLYRALAWAAIERSVDPTDAPALVDLVPTIDLEADQDGRLARVLVDGHDVTTAVHSSSVDAVVSAVARVPTVRSALLARQRALAAGGGIVMAGRDIGSVVLPDADLKLYLDASAEERARRRAVERGLDPGGAQAAAILAALRQRDETDRGRDVAPLRVADGAVVILTDGLDFDATVAAVVAAIRAVAGRDEAPA
jgi:cytidylate kinase